ncbi:LysR family transcription regulator protein [Herbaspirillum sp. GW103]|jgi:DNA-binding transcriptional LysR family regulator|uniref:LysR family transcriptional regulator n=1 Tax=unclassified Herbaspirillum TaxID=2624150 RepID=UPI00025E2A57|nr:MULTISPECIES: LysR family transcriptional regulator [unclassified Herbaspirillum]EIJ48749.1 LysR family transcription regulator protein [Herbaspirillum sp. GW103]MCI1006529.1 LysR family transcriptional regulator [Herbaspirillum sp. C7C8]
MLNPLWLQTFATAATASSFTEAGRQLGLTQSTVSDHIRRLEESLGRRLFVRDTHSLALTADGESLLVHARLILQAHARAEAQFSAPRLRGRVRFGTSDDLAMGPLPDMLAAFRSQHPEVELEITIGLTSDLYAALEQGKLDLLVGKRRAGESRGHSMFSTPMQWLTRPDTLVDLSEPLPLILLPEPSITRAATLQALGKSGHHWRIVCTSGSHAGCMAAARGGLGLAALPQHLGSRDLVEPLNHAALPRLPDVEYVALTARRLSRPADTLYQILMASRLSRG